MPDSKLSVVRWGAALPLALLAAGVAQIVALQAALALLEVGLGRTSEAHWAAKCVSATFIGAAFVAVARWTAPARKQLVARLGMAVVVLWSARLMAGAFAHEFVAVLLIMGLCGLLGGVVALLWAPQTRGPVPSA